MVSPIMNRLSTENLVEPINKDLEFQLQDPFLLSYRNGNCEMEEYTKWIVKQEADHAQRSHQRGQSSMRPMASREPLPTDILNYSQQSKGRIPE
ncbi:mRNA-decapping enzyme 1A, partial [Lates japonicus]